MPCVLKAKRIHDDVIKWKHFPRNWPSVRGIHRSPVIPPHKGQWRGTLMLSLTCAWINGWVNNREAGDLRRHRAHYDVIVMLMRKSQTKELRLPWTRALVQCHDQHIWVETKCWQFCRRHFQTHFLELNSSSWFQFHWNLFPMKSPNDNNPALVQIMGCRRTGDKPLSEPMMAQLIDAYWRLSVPMN